MAKNDRKIVVYEHMETIPADAVFLYAREVELTPSDRLTNPRKTVHFYYERELTDEEMRSKNWRK